MPILSKIILGLVYAALAEFSRFVVLYMGKIAGYKTELFANLKGKAGKVLEIGIGTGVNLRYYAGNNDLEVIGIDPNRKMERYARSAAMAAGLPLPNFKFIQAVCQLQTWTTCVIEL